MQVLNMNKKWKKKYFCGTQFFSSNVHISGLIGSRMLKFGDFLDNTQ